MILPSQEYLRQCFIYDPKSGYLFWLKRPRYHFAYDLTWVAMNNKFAGKRAGNPDKEGRWEVGVAGKTYQLARVIWKLETGDDPVEVDHKNGDPGDDRWENLRNTDHQRNMYNRRPDRGRTLPKGVVLRRSNGSFRAQIGHEGRTIYLGVFKTPEEAHAAYREAAIRLHKEFARFE